MSAGQREIGSLVIEYTGLPLDVAVTGFTALVFGLRGKLAGVNVLVTTFALQGRILEHDLAGAERKRGPAVTLLAGRAAVRSGESEAGLGMIEARHLAPRPHVMADFAGLRPTPGSEIPRRAIVGPTYLGLMRIEVTAGATEIGELIGRGIVELRLVPVAIAVRSRTCGWCGSR